MQRHMRLHAWQAPIALKIQLHTVSLHDAMRSCSPIGGMHELCVGCKHAIQFAVATDECLIYLSQASAGLLLQHAP